MYRVDELPSRENKMNDTNVFALDREPIDLQVSIHINNLFNTYPKFQVLSCYDYIRDSKNDYGFLYDVMKPLSDNEKMHIAMYNLMTWYGQAKLDQVLTELFQVKVA
jgi:hypothetical protein